MTANNSRACVEITRELSPPNSSRQQRTETALDHAEVDDPVLVAGLRHPSRISTGDRDDAAADAAALAHPLVHDRLSLCVVGVGGQQKFVDQDHGGAFFAAWVDSPQPTPAGGGLARSGARRHDPPVDWWMAVRIIAPAPRRSGED